MQVELADLPQFEWREIRNELLGSVPPSPIILPLAPNFYHRSLYIHSSRSWSVSLNFMLGGMIVFTIPWFSKLLPATPTNGTFRYSRLDDTPKGRNSLVLSDSDDAGTHLTPYYLKGKWDEVQVLTKEVTLVNQDWYVCLKSQTHF